MYYRSLKNYLKDLKIEKKYLKKFIFNKASYTLKIDLGYALKLIDREIERIEEQLEKYEKKNKENQITIYDVIISEGVLCKK